MNAALAGTIGNLAATVADCLAGRAGAVLRGLAGAGFDAYVGQQVPVNDGGISYGQAAVAAARLARR